MHSHDFSELVIVTDGHGIHQTGSHEDSIHQGDVFIIHGERSHGYDVITDMVIVNVLFDLSRLPLPSKETVTGASDAVGEAVARASGWNRAHAPP